VILRRLVVSQFRCWSYREFDLPGTLVYFAGPNGAGKTSLLEAVGFLSSGRSFRGARDRDCVQWERGGFSLRASTEGRAGGEAVDSLALAYREESGSDPHKVARVNDRVLPRLSALRRHLPTVVFSPEELRILEGGPDGRRRFLNDVLSHLHPGYMEAYRRYEEARRQRNSLLKRPAPDELLMEQYEATMAESGRTVIERRRELVEPIEQALVEGLEPVDRPLSEGLTFRYDPDVSEPASLTRILREERASARERGYTTLGPHRDDWMILLNGRPADRFASRGELRTLLLGLKIAQASIIIKRLETTPVLLLDDLESELDRGHRRRFLERVRGFPSQVLMTGTRLSGPDASMEADRIIPLEAGS